MVECFQYNSLNHWVSVVCVSTNVHACILYLKIPIECCINKYISHYVVLSDPPYTTAYNVTMSSSLTPADLSGFDIIISWNVSDDSVMGCHVHIYLHCLVFVIILYSQEVSSYV